MAAFNCTATVMGAVSGADRKISFEMHTDPETTPADDIVAAFVAKLHEVGDLPSPDAYELNSAIRNKDKRVVMAIGQMRRPRDENPFITMISY